MTEEVNFGKIAWDAYKQAVGNMTFNGQPLPEWEQVGERQKHGWDVAIEAVFDHIHDQIQHYDKKYKASTNWQQIWDEILAFIVSHIPPANTTPANTHG